MFESPSEAPGSVRFNRPVVIRSLQMMPTSLSGAGTELWVRGRLGGAEVWRHAWGRGGACGIGELVMGRPGGIWGGLPTIRVMTLRYFGDVLLLYIYIDIIDIIGFTMVYHINRERMW